uniref:Uncharacterized protein n=1 Tax=Panagrolaimus superbus TaxID=310955 RepID=A0A914YD14_9BILA
MVPKNECLEILPKNFARSYLLKLLTNYEIFMSPKGIPKSKRIEFKRIWKYFYPDRTDGKAQMKKWSLKLRDQKRRLVYKEIQTTHTFGITDSGNEFYFEKLRPEICYTRISCCAENVLPANPVGNCGIYVPQKHFIFKKVFY